VTAAPSGVVTFLFTDVEGSTRRWEGHADGMRAALAAHDEVLRTAIESHGGFLFSHTGDGVVAAYARGAPAPRERYGLPR
jgi:class 3 adenylate cyclase